MSLRLRSIALFLFASTVLCSSVNAAIIYVNDDAPGFNNGTSWQDAYLDLQTALNQAKAGDRVHIAQGFYRPAPPNGPREATFSIPNGVIVQGGFSGAPGSESSLPHPEAFFSFLSGDLNDDDGPTGSFSNYGENSYHVVTADGVTEGTELRGVIVSSGSALVEDSESLHRHGGGVLSMNSAILIQGTTIQDNQAANGGGVNGGVLGSPSVVSMEGCTIRRNRSFPINTSDGGGGVIAGSGSSFFNCEFRENTGLPVASAGALLTVNSTIQNCVFIDNQVSEDGGAILGGDLEIIDCEFISNGVGVFGGAIMVSHVSSQCLIENCTFRENSANSGGAVFAANPGTSMVRCRFVENSASQGGAVHGDVALINCDFFRNFNSPHGGGAGAALLGSGTVVNCLFSGNWTQDFGTIAGGPFEITNSTIIGNEAHGDPTIPSGAIHNFSGETAVRNCILWDNIGGTGNQQDGQVTVENGTVTVHNSIVEGWDGTLGGVGNSGADPQFIDADGTDGVYGTKDDNARLSEPSPARDAGNNAFLPSDDTDLDDDGNTTEPIPLDLDMQDRVVSGIVDCGAYEFQEQGCPADIVPASSGDGEVNVDDLLAVINAWGQCDNPNDCPADIDNDGDLDVDDLLAVINAWGTCP